MTPSVTRITGLLNSHQSMATNTTVMPMRATIVS